MIYRNTDPLFVGLQAWWPLNGTGVDLTLQYPAVVNNNTIVPSIFGPVFGFNGESSYLSVSTIPVLTSPLSISAWVYPTSLNQHSNGSGVGATVIESNNNGDENGWVLGIKNNRTLWFWTNGNDRFSDSLVNLNAWNHIVITIGGGNITMYLNGVFDSTTGIPTPQTPTFYNIGNLSWITGYMQGQMSNLMLYDRALSAAEAQRLYLQDWANNNTNIIETL